MIFSERYFRFIRGKHTLDANINDPENHTMACILEKIKKEYSYELSTKTRGYCSFKT